MQAPLLCNLNTPEGKEANLFSFDFLEVLIIVLSDFH